MSQISSPNRGSVADTFSALLQRIGRRNLKVRACDWSHPETLSRLTQIQETKSEAINPEIVMDRIVKLVRKELRADGTGVWLFTDNETFFGAGAGQASNDERLRLALLSTLLSSWRISKGSLTQSGKPVATAGGIKSWLVQPLYQGHNVAGVLAAFSSRLDAFAELDSAKIHSFADVLAQALTKAAAAGSAENKALEPATALQLIEQMIPNLLRMVGSDESWTDSLGEFQDTDSDLDPVPSLPNAQSAAEKDVREKAANTPEPAEATWMEKAPAPPRPPDASLFSADPQANSSAADQMKSEREPAESSNPTAENRPNLSRAVTFVKNYATRTLDHATVVKAWIANLDALRARFGTGLLITAAAVLLAVTTIGFFVFRTDPDFIQIVDSDSEKPAPEKTAAVADVQPTPPTYRETPQASPETPQAYRETPQAYRETPQASRETPKPEDVTPVATRQTEPAVAPVATRQTEPAVAPVATRQSQPAEQPRTSPTTQITHLQVTDNSARYAVRALSQYELAALRRRALYGDDSAAFLIGMAYEIGHGVRQDCKAAAQWVSNAAAEGNAVAQYNLGLRYRDGDGVPINPEAAMKWLQKAASHKIPGAQVALVDVTSRQGQVAASQP